MMNLVSKPNAVGECCRDCRSEGQMDEQNSTHMAHPVACGWDTSISGVGGRRDGGGRREVLKDAPSQSTG